MPDTNVPVVASTGLAPVLTGALRPGTVVGAGPAAAYVVLDAPVGTTPLEVVAIEAPGAVGLPCGLGLTAGALGWLPGTIAVGARVRVGAGRVHLDGAVLRVARWRPCRPALAPTAADELRTRVACAGARLPRPTDPIGTQVRDRADDLARAGGDRDLDGAVAAAGRLCGLGEGSTPSGDDVVAGAVAAGTLLGTPDEATWWARLGRRAAAYAVGRTTTLAAALLVHAARGEVADPVAGLLRALAGDGHVDDAMTRVLAVGHRSGADLAHGVLLASDLVASSSTTAHVREAAHA